jgi:3-dehydroquinate synthase
MIMEAYLSFERKMIDQQTLTDIEEFLFATYGKVKIKPEDVEQIIALTRQDKKNKGKEIRFSLLSGAGQCAFDIVVTAAEMRRSIAYYLG